MICLFVVFCCLIVRCTSLDLEFVADQVGEMIFPRDLQLEKLSLPTSYCFRMECRRWAPMRSLRLVFFLCLFLFLDSPFPPSLALI